MSESATLLLVDDHEGNRITLEALLADEGFAVDTADGYEEARRYFERATDYDVVVLDLFLGKHSALPLIEPIRARWPRAKLAIITGAPDACDPSLVDAVLRKSDRFESLLQRIKLLLKASPAPQPQLHRLMP